MTKWTVQKHLKHYDQPLILCFIWIHPFLFLKVIELTISVKSSEKDASSAVYFYFLHLHVCSGIMRLGVIVI